MLCSSIFAINFAKTVIRPTLIIIIIIERINLWYVRKCNAREDRHSRYKGNYMVEVEHEKLRKAIIHVHNTEPVTDLQKVDWRAHSELEAIGYSLVLGTIITIENRCESAKP